MVKRSVARIWPNRGLRQGDPISLYLFLFVQDAFYGLINKAILEGSRTGVKLGRECPPLTYIFFFANGSFLFLRGDDRECDKAFELVENYCWASGQSINVEKSEVFYSSNCDQDTRKIIC
ncbi:hypothetical protein LguiB_035429 [Lonicera macranthoides]